MIKKYRLEIVFPVSEENFSMAHWIKQAELNNKTCILKDGAYIFNIEDGEEVAPKIEQDDINHDWLTKIKEPLSVGEWHSMNKPTLDEAGMDCVSTKQVGIIWNAALENQKLGDVDEESDHQAMVNYLETLQSGQPANARLIWNNALKHARDIS
jgi:hypothetical protein